MKIDRHKRYSYLMASKIVSLGEVTCPVCLEIFTKPYKIKCGHTFCHGCVKRLGEAAGENACCPECRTKYSVTDARHDSQMEKILKYEQGKCDGCGNMFPLSKLKSHQSQCSPSGKLSTSFMPVASTKQQIPKNVPNRSTFKCPYCAEKNLDIEGLRAHCNRKHPNDRNKVVCPVCTSMPWGDPNFVSSDFISHINNRHKFEYETYVDYEEDEDETLRRVLAESMMLK